MQTEQPKRRSFSSFVIIALVIGFAAGYGIEYALTQPTVQQLNNTVNQLQAGLATSNSKLEALSSEKAQLQSKLNSTKDKLSSLNEQLTAEQGQLTRALANLQGNLTTTAKLQTKLSLVQNATGKLDNDRILLGDLRQDVPFDKEAARTFWEGVKSRAVKVDLTLGPAVDSILSTLDNYYTNWIYPLGNATSTDQIGQIVLDSVGNGALDYQINTGKFQQEALLVIGTHIDQLISITTQ